MEILELVGKQQVEIEKYKEAFRQNDELTATLNSKFYAIGAPLNDNKLKFNKEQLKWCFEVYDILGCLRNNL